MTNLVIHPFDKTTRFLSPIYENLNEKTVLNFGRFSDNSIRDTMILKYDRILMMGHGSPGGLFSNDYLICDDVFIINNSFKEVLSNFDQNIYIWCHADKFVKNNNLKGFYSGMFISEKLEAVFMGILNVTDEMVEESNNEFSMILSKYINDDCKVIYDNVRKEYSQFGELKKNPVIMYNYDRLYIS